MTDKGKLLMGKALKIPGAAEALEQHYGLKTVTPVLPVPDAVADREVADRVERAKDYKRTGGIVADLWKRTGAVAQSIASEYLELDYRVACDVTTAQKEKKTGLRPGTLSSGDAYVAVRSSTAAAGKKAAEPIPTPTPSDADSALLRAITHMTQLEASPILKAAGRQTPDAAAAVQKRRAQAFAEERERTANREVLDAVNELMPDPKPKAETPQRKELWVSGEGVGGWAPAQ